jgi:hypothetical protein
MPDTWITFYWTDGSFSPEYTVHGGDAFLSWMEMSVN